MLKSYSEGFMNTGSGQPHKPCVVRRGGTLKTIKGDRRVGRKPGETQRSGSVSSGIVTNIFQDFAAAELLEICEGRRRSDG